MSLLQYLKSDLVNRQAVAEATPLPVVVRDSSGTEGPLGTSGDPVFTSAATAGHSGTATFTPAAAAYSAGDVMDVAKQITGIGPSGGGEVLITSTYLEVAHTALISGETSYNLELYNVTPPSAHADNDAWDLPSGDRTAHIATVSLGTPVDKGSTLKVRQDGLNIQITVPDGGAVYAELVTVGGFTATAAARKVTLKTVAL